MESLRSARALSAENKTSNIQLRTRFLRNLAYRITNIYDQEPTSGGGAAWHSIAITEDAKGRVVTRDYTPSDPTLAGLYDSYFLYDMQDRVTCETHDQPEHVPDHRLRHQEQPGRPVHERRRLETRTSGRSRAAPAGSRIASTRAATARPTRSRWSGRTTARLPW